MLQFFYTLCKYRHGILCLLTWYKVYKCNHKKGNKTWQDYNTTCFFSFAITLLHHRHCIATMCMQYAIRSTPPTAIISDGRRNTKIINASRRHGRQVREKTSWLITSPLVTLFLLFLLQFSSIIVRNITSSSHVRTQCNIIFMCFYPYHHSHHNTTITRRCCWWCWSP